MNIFQKRKSFRGRLKFELDLPKYATKSDLKKCNNRWCIGFSKNNDSSNLKSHVDKLDIDKLKNVSINLGNLKSKVDKLDVDKLLPVPLDLHKLAM